MHQTGLELPRAPFSDLLRNYLHSPRERPAKVVPAVNDIDLWQQVGQQPYEMSWTQREENPHTLADFEDLSGWTLELDGGAIGELHRSREQQMWGQYVAKFVFSGPVASGANRESRVVARPPKPIAIPGDFDSVDLWGYGNRWGWQEDKTTPAVDVAILIADAHGKEFRVPGCPIPTFIRPTRRGTITTSTHACLAPAR